MSKAVTAQPHSTLSRLWHKWRFHINILLLLVPLGFMPKYFADASLFRGDSGLGERDVGTVQVGPWSLQLAELRNEGPRPDGPAGYMKSFNAALSDSSIDQVKAAYLRIGKPRSLRAAGVIFSVRPIAWAPRCRSRSAPKPTPNCGSPLKGGTARCIRRPFP
jgi:hypothetical protein